MEHHFSASATAKLFSTWGHTFNGDTLSDCEANAIGNAKLDHHSYAIVCALTRIAEALEYPQRMKDEADKQARRELLLIARNKWLDGVISTLKFLFKKVPKGVRYEINWQVAQDEFEDWADWDIDPNPDVESFRWCLDYELSKKKFRGRGTALAWLREHRKEIKLHFGD